MEAVWQLSLNTRMIVLAQAAVFCFILLHNLQLSQVLIYSPVTQHIWRINTRETKRTNNLGNPTVTHLKIIFTLHLEIVLKMTHGKTELCRTDKQGSNTTQSARSILMIIMSSKHLPTVQYVIGQSSVSVACVIIALLHFTVIKQQYFKLLLLKKIYCNLVCVCVCNVSC